MRACGAAAILTASGENLIYHGAKLDVVKSQGNEVVLSRRRWPRDGIFEFRLAERSENVEFRIFRDAESAEFSCLRLERVSE